MERDAERSRTRDQRIRLLDQHEPVIRNQVAEITNSEPSADDVAGRRGARPGIAVVMSGSGLIHPDRGAVDCVMEERNANLGRPFDHVRPL